MNRITINRINSGLALHSVGAWRLLLCAAFLSVNLIGVELSAQCPTAGCTTTISTPSSGTYTLTAGQKLCLAAGADFSGTINLSGGELVICSTIPQSFTLNYNFNTGQSRVENHGDVTLSSSGNIIDVIIENHGSYSTVGNKLMQGEVNITNHGQMSFSGSLVLHSGTSFLDNYGDCIVGTTFQLNSTSHLNNFGTGTFTMSDLVANSTWYNQGIMMILNDLMNQGSAIGTIDGGCINIANNFTNQATLTSAICGTITIANTSTNNGTLSSSFAIVDLTPPASAPFIDNQWGTLGPGIQWVSCGCPGVPPPGEICGNGIDDDGDGKIDNEDPQCFDNDGDGITNADDMDDDNDGVPDSLDSTSDIELFAQFGIGNPVSGTGLYNVPGTAVSYASSFSGPECVTYQAGLQGPALKISEPSNSFTPIRFDFNPPVYNISFKVTDIDWIEEFDLFVYDENFDLYDLNSNGVVSVGSNILQNQIDGRRFSGQGLGIDIDGNDPANDNICSAVFHFPGQVGTVLLNMRTFSGNSIRLTEMDFNVIDTDSDGLIDSWDLDSDNDGIYDVIEAGGADADGDGIIGTGPISDTDSDGWSDITDPDNGGTLLSDPDTDSDGQENRVDSDSDGDSCNDVIEAGFPDSDGDGQLGGLVPPTVNTSGTVTSGGL